MKKDRQTVFLVEAELKYSLMAGFSPKVNILTLAAFLLWFNNSRSMQATPSMIGSVYFDGEYMSQYAWAEETCAMLIFEK